MMLNMAVFSNGKAVKAEYPPYGMNQREILERAREKKKQKSWTKSIFSITTRLLAWYSIFAIAFWCPSNFNLLTDESPKICKPYLHGRDAILPHLEPYYEAYAAPYVETVRPYYNSIDQHVFTPAVNLGKKYGGPRIAQAQEIAYTQWTKTVQPHLLKYKSQAEQQYMKTLAPHVKKAAEAVGPYYAVAKDGTLRTYEDNVLPAYNTVKPHALSAYGHGSKFLVDTGIPYTKWAWASGSVFLERKVWPRVRILYGENVEPQLIRIGERLGRYRDGKKLKAAIEDLDVSSSESLTIQTIIPTSSTSAYSTVPPSSSSSPSSAMEAPGETELNRADMMANARAVVSEDLKNWQERFAKAADEGSDELEERVNEITDTFIKSQARGVGEALIIELEETVKSQIKGLQKTINSIVKRAPEDAEEELASAIRKAGVALKDKAQAARTWRTNYDLEINDLISLSSRETFEIIDHIRELGLSEIGRRWAWTDGITHKDWKKYHALQGKFDEWRHDVEEVVTKHPGLVKARAAGEDIENRAMAIGAEASQELVRLKDVGKWKLATGDSSDDFSTKIMPAVVENAAQKVLKKIGDISEAISGTSTGTVESFSSLASESASSVAGDVKNLASSAQEKASSLADQASSSIIGTQQGTVESLTSIAKESASSIADQASGAIVGTSQGSVESIASVATETASSLATVISSVVVGTEPGMAEQASSSIQSAASGVSSSASGIASGISSSASSIASDASKSASSASSATSKMSSSASAKVWGGAEAQFVEARQIIYDDIIDDDTEDNFSHKIQSMASEAGDRFSDVTNAVSEALLGTTTTQGSVESVTSLAAEQYSSAIAAASKALYGTPLGTGESIASVASSRYSEAVSAASSVIYGTPTPLAQSVAAEASSLYNNAISNAKEQSASAVSMVSAQISGEPKPAQQQVLDSAASAYSDSVAAANSRLNEAVSFANSKAAGASEYLWPTQGALESVSSVAASKLSEALNAASAQYSSVKTAVGATPTPASQKLLSQAQQQYYMGIGMAHERYSEFVAAASSAIMPTPTPFHKSLYNAASASIIGTPTPAYMSVIDAAHSQYDSAASVASSALAGALSSVSQLGSDAGDSIPAASLLAGASSKYSSVMAEASQILSSASAAASVQVYGSETGTLESMTSKVAEQADSVASAASTNLESLVSAASAQIYGQPTPVYESIYSQAGDYASQATQGVAAQYEAVQALISDLVVGKEPDFTESVYSRFTSAYYTGAPEFYASATSYANENAAAASSYASGAYDAASSVVVSVFTPPPVLEDIISNASSQLDAAVEAASAQIYGTTTGYAEAASASASSAYSAASEAIYGHETGYAEAASSSISNAADNAASAISLAIYGSTTGVVESATSVAGDTMASATSVIGENFAAATDAVGDIYSRLFVEEEKSAAESAKGRLEAAVESARTRLAEMAAQATDGAGKVVGNMEEMVGSVAAQVTSSTSSKKDEL